MRRNPGCVIGMVFALLLCVPQAATAGPILLHAGDRALYTIEFSALDMTDAYWFDFDLQVSPLPGAAASGYTESWEYTDGRFGVGPIGPVTRTSFELKQSLGSTANALVSTAFFDYQLVDVQGSVTNSLLYFFDISVRSRSDVFLGNPSISATVSGVPSPGTLLLLILGLLALLTLQGGFRNRVLPVPYSKGTAR